MSWEKCGCQVPRAKAELPKCWRCPMAHSEIINGDDLGTREASEKVSKMVSSSVHYCGESIILKCHMARLTTGLLAPIPTYFTCCFHYGDGNTNSKPSGTQCHSRRETSTSPVCLTRLSVTRPAGVRRLRRHAALQLAHATWKTSRPPCPDVDLVTDSDTPSPALPITHVPQTTISHYYCIDMIRCCIAASAGRLSIAQTLPTATVDLRRAPTPVNLRDCSMFSSRNLKGCCPLPAAREVTSRHSQELNSRARMAAARQAR